MIVLPLFAEVTELGLFLSFWLLERGSQDELGNQVRTIKMGGGS
jgi:hypothetical protein